MATRPADPRDEAQSACPGAEAAEDASGESESPGAAREIRLSRAPSSAPYSAPSPSIALLIDEADMASPVSHAGPEAHPETPQRIAGILEALVRRGWIRREGGAGRARGERGRAECPTDPDELEHAAGVGSSRRRAASPPPSSAPPRAEASPVGFVSACPNLVVVPCGRLATDDELGTCHASDYISRIDAFSPAQASRAPLATVPLQRAAAAFAARRSRGEQAGRETPGGGKGQTKKGSASAAAGALPGRLRKGRKSFSGRPEAAASRPSAEGPPGSAAAVSTASSSAEALAPPCASLTSSTASSVSRAAPSPGLAPRSETAVAAIGDDAEASAVPEASSGASRAYTFPFGSDTFICPRTSHTARLAAGAALALCDLVLGPPSTGAGGKKRGDKPKVRSPKSRCEAAADGCTGGRSEGDKVQREGETSDGTADDAGQARRSSGGGSGGGCRGFEMTAKRVKRGFALIRPPGHHACAKEAAGFCIYNNVALAARYLLDVHGLARVAILDWDVHHGDGTQELFYSSSSVLYLSVHRYEKAKAPPSGTRSRDTLALSAAAGPPSSTPSTPSTALASYPESSCSSSCSSVSSTSSSSSFSFYPGTGSWTETGVGPGRGYSVNVPLSRGFGDADMFWTFCGIFAPALTAFRPQAILVSAGFDAAAGDPLGGCCLSSAAFGWMTRQVCRLADLLCDGHALFFLEGGYAVDVLANCVEACVEELLRLGDDEAPRSATPKVNPPQEGDASHADSAAGTDPAATEGGNASRANDEGAGTRTIAGQFRDRSQGDRAEGRTVQEGGRHPTSTGDGGRVDAGQQAGWDKRADEVFLSPSAVVGSSPSSSARPAPAPQPRGEEALLEFAPRADAALGTRQAPAPRRGSPRRLSLPATISLPVSPLFQAAASAIPPSPALSAAWFASSPLPLDDKPRPRFCLKCLCLSEKKPGLASARSRVRGAVGPSSCGLPGSGGLGACEAGPRASQSKGALATPDSEYLGDDTAFFVAKRKFPEFAADPLPAAERWALLTPAAVEVALRDAAGLCPSLDVPPRLADGARGTPAEARGRKGRRDSGKAKKKTEKQELRAADAADTGGRRESDDALASPLPALQRPLTSETVSEEGDDDLVSIPEDAVSAAGAFPLAPQPRSPAARRASLSSSSCSRSCGVSRSALSLAPPSSLRVVASCPPSPLPSNSAPLLSLPPSPLALTSLVAPGARSAEAAPASLSPSSAASLPPTRGVNAFCSSVLLGEGGEDLRAEPQETASPASPSQAGKASSRLALRLRLACASCGVALEPCRLAFASSASSGAAALAACGADAWGGGRPASAAASPSHCGSRSGVEVDEERGGWRGRWVVCRQATYEVLRLVRLLHAGPPLFLPALPPLPKIVKTRRQSVVEAADEEDLQRSRARDAESGTEPDLRPSGQGAGAKEGCAARSSEGTPHTRPSESDEAANASNAHTSTGYSASPPASSTSTVPPSSPGASGGALARRRVFPAGLLSHVRGRIVGGRVNRWLLPSLAPPDSPLQSVADGDSQEDSERAARRRSKESSSRPREGKECIKPGQLVKLCCWNEAAFYTWTQLHAKTLRKGARMDEATQADHEQHKATILAELQRLFLRLSPPGDGEREPTQVGGRGGETGVNPNWGPQAHWKSQRTATGDPHRSRERFVQALLPPACLPRHEALHSSALSFNPSQLMELLRTPPDALALPASPPGSAVSSSRSCEASPGAGAAGLTDVATELSKFMPTCRRVFWSHSWAVCSPASSPDDKHGRAEPARAACGQPDTRSAHASSSKPPSSHLPSSASPPSLAVQPSTASSPVYPAVSSSVASSAPFSPSFRCASGSARFACAIAVEDVAYFVRPCVMDVKMGTQMYDGSCTDLEKVRRMQAKARERSFASHGFSVCGVSAAAVDSREAQPRLARERQAGGAGDRQGTTACGDEVACRGGFQEAVGEAAREARGAGGSGQGGSEREAERGVLASPRPFVLSKQDAYAVTKDAEFIRVFTQFFCVNGSRRLAVRLIRKCLEKLETLRVFFERQEQVSFYGSSLLFVFDAGPLPQPRAAAPSSAASVARPASDASSQVSQTERGCAEAEAHTRETKGLQSHQGGSAAAGAQAEPRGDAAGAGGETRDAAAEGGSAPSQAPLPHEEASEEARVEEAIVNSLGVYMVDFAHVNFSESGRDTGYLFGLANLHRLFSAILLDLSAATPSQLS
ncbi:hypothetical protein BESB_030940 [Besnoitia besnoiti]|uniref:histone deacetylase n=1 Tax=Besnoitia besnoiti TaxID=94643 RepID=A0A2A9M736_BESBE|nr:hypothetical protein BESB_030940 [Besnoitia besnoiti]PFH31220.1 hypothetical protein BESB_030940 [Besnoitia besnoiti]